MLALNRNRILLPLLVAASVLIFLTIASIAQIRLRELHAGLNDIGRARTNANADALVARYQMLQKELRSPDSLPGSDYKSEAKTQLLMAGVMIDRKRFDAGLLAFMEPFTVRMLNFMNRIAGSSKIIVLDRSEKDELLSLAYYFERSRRFARAVKTYNEALTRFDAEEDPEFKAYIHLHRGFSYSILGRFSDARADYNTCIKTTRLPEVKKAALRLLNFISQFTERNFDYIQPENASVKQAELMYRNMLYKEAQTVFQKIIAKSKGKERDRAIYLLGQANEALGRYKEAAAAYAQLQGKDKYSKMANRRLYMMTTFYVKNEELREVTVQRAKQMQDKKFISSMRKYSKRTTDIDLSGLQKLGRDIGILSKDGPDMDELDFDPGQIRSLEKAELTVELLKAELQKLSSKKAKRDFLKATYSYLDKVFLYDGQIFVGKKTGETPSALQLATEYGILDLPKADIKKVTVIQADQY